MNTQALKPTCLWHTSLPVDMDGNIFAVSGAIGRALRQCRVPRSEIDAFYEEVHAAKSYREALAVCARMIDMDEWLDAHGYEDVPR